uniref:Uncharacterized protein n=1 Tax=Rhizophora mucronata TaxID=61149 RepID=A0A2P2QJ38_RHIMU
MVKQLHTATTNSYSVSAVSWLILEIRLKYL